MARGYPDYFGQQIFPKFGLCTIQTNQIASIADTATEDIFDLSLKGKIFSGFILLESLGWDPAAIIMSLTVDGTTLSAGTITQFLDNYVFKPAILPLYLIKYDKVSKKIVLGVSSDITFGYEYKVTCENNVGFAIDVTAGLYYFHITL